MPLTHLRLPCLAGNDFIPPLAAPVPFLPSLNVFTGGMSLLLRVYRSISSTWGGEYLTTNGVPDGSRLGEFLQAVAVEMEAVSLKQCDVEKLPLDGDLPWDDDRRFNSEWPWGGDVLVAPRHEATAATDASHSAKPDSTQAANAVPAAASAVAAGTGGGAGAGAGAGAGSGADATARGAAAAVGEDTAKQIASLRQQYYQDYFQVDGDAHAESREKLLSVVCHEYVRGVYWVMRYYYAGCPAWEWVFPFYFAPLPADVAARYVWLSHSQLGHEHIALTRATAADVMLCWACRCSGASTKFVLGAPQRSFQRLLGILPREAAMTLLPPPFNELTQAPEFDAAFPPYEVRRASRTLVCTCGLRASLVVRACAGAD